MTSCLIGATKLNSARPMLTGYQRAVTSLGRCTFGNVNRVVLERGIDEVVGEHFAPDSNKYILAFNSYIQPGTVTKPSHIYMSVLPYYHFRVINHLDLDK